MKTIKELSTDQFNLLSWFATFVYNHKILNPGEMNQYYTGKLQGIQSACSFAGIPNELLYSVEIDMKLTGLRNYNKLTKTLEIILFK